MKLLNQNVPVLLYAGDLDYICNNIGTGAFALNLEWNHEDDFNSAEQDLEYIGQCWTCEILEWVDISTSLLQVILCQQSRSLGGSLSEG